MIEKFSANDLIELGSRFYDDQLYIVLLPILDKKRREEVALKPEESWYYALKILNRLGNSKRPEYEILRIRSELEEELRTQYNYHFSISATYIILWCVFYMIISYFKDRESPYKEIENSLIGILKSNEKLSQEICLAVYNMEKKEEFRGNVVARKDYVQYSKEFFIQLSSPLNTSSNNLSSICPELFTTLTTPYWIKLRNKGFVDEHFMRYKSDNGRESAVIAHYFCEILGTPNNWNPFKKFWNLDKLAQYYYSETSASTPLSTLNEIKNIFGL